MVWSERPGRRSCRGAPPSAAPGAGGLTADREYAAGRSSSAVRPYAAITSSLTARSWLTALLVPGVAAGLAARGSIFLPNFGTQRGPENGNTGDHLRVAANCLPDNGLETSIRNVFRLR